MAKLVLTRNVGGDQWVQIGPDIKVRVLSVRRNKQTQQVRLLIEAPREVRILRGPELVDEGGGPRPGGSDGGGTGGGL